MVVPRIVEELVLELLPRDHLHRLQNLQPSTSSESPQPVWVPNTRFTVKLSRAEKKAASSESQTRKRKALNKIEKATITLSIQEADINGGIVPTVTQVVTAQSHIQSCPDKICSGRYSRILVSS